MKVNNSINYLNRNNSTNSKSKKNVNFTMVIPVRLKIPQESMVKSDFHLKMSLLKKIVHILRTPECFFKTDQEKAIFKYFKDNVKDYTPPMTKTGTDPLVCSHIDENGRMYLFTGLHSAKIKELYRNRQNAILHAKLNRASETRETIFTTFQYNSIIKELINNPNIRFKTPEGYQPELNICLEKGLKSHLKLNRITFDNIV